LSAYEIQLLLEEGTGEGSSETAYEEIRLIHKAVHEEDFDLLFSYTSKFGLLSSERSEAIDTKK
jgi:hypothetical protein